MATITVNGIKTKVKNGTTILNAVESIGIKIPTLCFIEEINEIGFCRICVVEVKGEQDLISACNTEVVNGMVIETDSEKVLNSRIHTLNLLAGKHRFDCWKCPKDGMCEFYDLLKEYDILFKEFGPGVGRKDELVLGTGISQDQTKCVLCKRCVAVCQNVVTTKILKFRDDDGMNPFVSPTVGLSFDEAGCIFCGQCVKVCPTGTLFETDHVSKVEEFLRDPKTLTVVQPSIEVFAALGEEFGMDIGSSIEENSNKTFGALDLLGFDEITNLSLASNLRDKEEATEFINSILNSEDLPFFTSTCSAAVRYMELYQPKFINDISKAKSTHMIQGSLIKHYYGKKYLEKSPQEIKVISVMPCTSKKNEISLDGMEADGIRDVDAVLTIRELAKMIKRKGIDFNNLKDYKNKGTLAKLGNEDLSSLIVESAAIKALKIASDVLDNKPLEKLNWKIIMGDKLKDSKGVIEETTVTINEIKLNVAIAHGGAAMKEMFKIINEGKKQYHLIELLGCPGGCINGGGMPIVIDLPMHEVIKRRTQALSQVSNVEQLTDNYKENKVTKRTFDEFLKDDTIIQKHCHTHYTQKEFRNE